MGGERDTRRSRLSREWDALAPTYDLQRPLERDAVARLIDLLDPDPADRMLDLGTGTGAVLCELASRPHHPGDVLGIDSSAEMLDRVPPLPEGWRTQRGEVTDLPVADGSVEVLSASYLLHVLDEEDRRHALAEMVRVLRPGGRAGILVPALPRGALRTSYVTMAALLSRCSPTAFGMRVIDAAAELERAGLRVERGAYVRRGYPSLCLLARPGQPRLPVRPNSLAIL